jgi:hypothetical protein
MKHFRRQFYCYEPYIVDLFMSDERARESRDDLGTQVEMCIHHDFNLILVRGYDAFSEVEVRRRGLVHDLLKKLGHPLPPRIAILDAHGGSQESVWVYYDRNKCYPVQGWVSAHDRKKYSALFLVCCNPSNGVVTARRTLVFYPDNILGYSRHYAVKKAAPS